MAIIHDGKINDGFVKIPNIIFRSGLPMRAVAVMGNIMSHAEYFPVTVSIIADQLGISRETVNKAVQDLEDVGLLTRMKAPAKNGQWQRNDYVLNNNALNRMAAEYVLEQSRRDQNLGTDHDQNLGTDHDQNLGTDHDQNLGTKKTSSKRPRGEEGVGVGGNHKCPDGSGPPPPLSDDQIGEAFDAFRADTPDESRCQKHAGLPAHEVPSCGACRGARVAAEDRKARQQAEELARERQRAAQCRFCGGSNRVSARNGQGQLVERRCDHVSVPVDAPREVGHREVSDPARRRAMIAESLNQRKAS